MPKRNDIQYLVKSAVLGMAAGDALGVPVEFLEREQLRRSPVTDMKGGGTHRMPAGTWSDDTSMAIAAMDCLIDGVDYEKIMDAFCDWRYKSMYTATGVCFDIGMTTQRALSRYREGTPPLLCGGNGERDNGNGSLMRILPFALCGNVAENMEHIYNGSALTHRHPRSLAGCGIYAFIIEELMKEQSKNAVKLGLSRAAEYFADHEEYSAYARLFAPDFAALSESAIKSDGYVVHTLEASVWCILNTDSFAECALKAVNLGSDTDTTGAVAGSIAGLLYGMDGIPEKWLDLLGERDMLENIAECFAETLN